MSTAPRPSSSPRAVRPAWINDALYPFESRFLELDGHTLHYLDEGPRDAPTLLFLHGNPVWSFEFRHLVGALRGAFRCIAPDLPGFGGSTAAADYGFSPAEHSALVGRFVNALDLRALTLYVHDWSGPIGLGAAARNPERLAGLIIGSTWTRPDIGGMQRWASKVIDTPLGRYLVRRHNVFIEYALNLARSAHPLADDELEHYRRPFPDARSRERHLKLAQAITRDRAFVASVDASLSRLSHLPVLFLWPDQDRAFPLSELRRFEARFEDHHTVVLDGVGHFAPEEAPDQMVAAIRRWWRQRMRP